MAHCDTDRADLRSRSPCIGRERSLSRCQIRCALIVQLWLYATPIIYPFSAVPASWQVVLHLNPMATIIDGYRGAVLYSQLPKWQDIVSATILSLVILVIGYKYFKRTE